MTDQSVTKIASYHFGVKQKKCGKNMRGCRLTKSIII